MGKFLNNWRHYLPALWLIGLALFFGAFPMVAAMLLCTALTFAAALYAVVVYQSHKASLRRSTYRYDPSSGYSADPTFRNVTRTIFQSGRWRDVSP